MDNHDNAQPTPFLKSGKHEVGNVSHKNFPPKEKLGSKMKCSYQSDVNISSSWKLSLVFSLLQILSNSTGNLEENEVL